MPSDTQVKLAYDLGRNRFFRIKTEDGKTKLEGADGATYPFLRWKGDLELPLAKSTAIEFNGIWEYDNLRRRYNFIGDEKPYIFWVEQDGKLYGRLWDEEDTTFLLAEDVVQCSAVRGWKNVFFWNHDQGIVVAYIKTDGKVYYRNFCKQPPDQEAVWEVERLVEEFPSPAQNVSVFRTNDYRTGIACESNGKVYWVLSERDWAGMAVPAEFISAVPDVEIEFIAIEYPEIFTDESITAAPDVTVEFLFASTENEIVNLINVPKTMLDENEEEYEDWGYLIEFEIKNEAINIPNVLLTNVDMQQVIAIEKIDYLGENKYLIHISSSIENGINNVTGDIKIKITGAINEAEKVYEDMEDTFTPINLNPTFIPVPEVESIWNE